MKFKHFSIEEREKIQELLSFLSPPSQLNTLYSILYTYWHMSDFTFEEDPAWEKYKKDIYQDNIERVPILVRLLMKTGLGKNACYYVLFGILIVCSFITFIIVRATFSPAPIDPSTYNEYYPEEYRRAMAPK